MQEMGTEFFRSKDSTHWSRVWLNCYLGIPGDKPVVISDVRFESEAALIRSLGGVVIHIHRDGAGLTGENAAHASEAGIEMHSTDVGLSNNSTFEELEERLQYALGFVEKYGVGRSLVLV